jgi:predicted O-methyltransferase YrrM
LFGVQLVGIPPYVDPNDVNPCSRVAAFEHVVDLPALERIAFTIPGMTAPQFTNHLFALCYFQTERGDVAEIGSWQGRSASFLARAVAESGNGRFFAIDHFKGNVDRHHLFVIGAADLSDLEAGFRGHMARIGLADNVDLLAMSSAEAAARIADRSLRFLFIDGDHSREGVEADLALFLPKLVPGAIVAFDDFAPVNFPGVRAAIEGLLKRTVSTRVMTYPNTLVLKL